MADEQITAVTPPFADTEMSTGLREQLTRLWEGLAHEEQVLIAAVLAEVRRQGKPLRITVGNLKGGAAKSTTAVYLALMLAFLGEKILLIDGDSRNNSVLTWKAGAADDWPMNIQVLPWGTPDLARNVKNMEGQFRHLIVDTSPVLAEILESALLVTDTFLVVTLPNVMDVQQVTESMKLAEKIDDTKQSLGAGELAAVVVFVRAQSLKAVLLRQAREKMDEYELPYLPSVVVTRNPYIVSYPVYPRDFLDYVHVFADLAAFALDVDAIPGIEAHAQEDED